MSEFSLYIGGLTYGGFGSGAASVPALVPLNSGDEGYCNFLERKMLQNPQGGTGSGNFFCEGCEGSDGLESWDITEVRTSTAAAGDGLVISKDYEGLYFLNLTDGVTNIGYCDSTARGGVESCNDSLDVYDLMRYFECTTYSEEIVW